MSTGVTLRRMIWIPRGRPGRLHPAHRLSMNRRSREFACNEARGCWLSEFAAVVSPVQQRLALPAAAGHIARFAMALQLPDVAADGLPALDLPRVFFGQAASRVIAAIPLKPAARVIGVNPSL